MKSIKRLSFTGITITPYDPLASMLTKKGYFCMVINTNQLLSKHFQSTCRKITISYDTNQSRVACQKGLNLNKPFWHATYLKMLACQKGVCEFEPFWHATLDSEQNMFISPFSMPASHYIIDVRKDVSFVHMSNDNLLTVTLHVLIMTRVGQVCCGYPEMQQINL